MNQQHFSIQNIAYYLIALIAFGYLMVVGKFILIPVILSILLSILILPIQHFFSKFIKNNSLNAFLTLLAVLIPLSGVITFFSFQIGEIIYDLDNITLQIQKGTSTLFEWLYTNFGMEEEEAKGLFKDNLSKLIASPISIFQSSINSFANILLNIGFVLIFIFFILLYKDGFKNFILMQFEHKTRQRADKTLSKVQKTMRQYIYGMLSVMAILAVLNSIGLLIIGVDYAIFWATLAAFLTIIPYIGTTLGGTLPFLFCLATASYWWQPLAVVIMYGGIQQIEGNLITPYVVGTKVRINPLIALLFILLMNALWGVVGIILAIPFAAILKIILDQMPRFRPIGALMSSNIIKNKGKFLNEWDDSRFRLFPLFAKDQQEEKDCPPDERMQ